MVGQGCGSSITMGCLQPWVGFPALQNKQVQLFYGTELVAQMKRWFCSMHPKTLSQGYDKFSCSKRKELRSGFYKGKMHAEPNYQRINWL